MTGDRLICGVCRGEKVIRKPVKNLIKVDICPKCKGTGSLMSENDWRKNSSKRLIKG
jgi:Zn-finger nucleic acid-binding protein